MIAGAAGNIGGPPGQLVTLATNTDPGEAVNCGKAALAGGDTGARLTAPPTLPESAFAPVVSATKMFTVSSAESEAAVVTS
jgi:hypothetical protein